MENTLSTVFVWCGSCMFNGNHQYEKSLELTVKVTRSRMFEQMKRARHKKCTTSSEITEYHGSMDYMLSEQRTWKFAIKTRHVFVKHGCPRRQQSRNMAKISKSYILTPPHPQGHVMSVKCEQPIDELTVQVWLLYHNPNFKYCTLFVSGTGRDGITDGQTDKRTNGQTDGWTDRRSKH